MSFPDFPNQPADPIPPDPVPVVVVVPSPDHVVTVPAHEQDERFTEHDLIAVHAERAESTTFAHNKALLVAQHPGCWMNTDVCDPARPIEAHHCVEWCQTPAVDFIRLKATLMTFDPYGYSIRLAALPIESIDDIRNLVLLCDRCHRGLGLGAHHLSFPTWLARKARRDGLNVTVEEAVLRTGFAPSGIASPDARV